MRNHQYDGLVVRRLLVSTDYKSVVQEGLPVSTHLPLA